MSAIPLDFAKIKAENPIEEVAKRLGIELKPDGIKLRGFCPKGGGDDRAFVVTPSKGVWFSNVAKVGGGVFELVAFVLGCNPQREAAAWIKNGEFHEPEKSAPGAKTTTVAVFTPVEVLSDHPSVLVSGIDAEDAKRFRIGWKETGSGNGNILIPVYDNGRLCGYVGVQEITWLPKKWR